LNIATAASENLCTFVDFLMVLILLMAINSLMRKHALS